MERCSRSWSVSRCRRRRSSYLPDELIFKILSWASVISLLRCKSVCKSWLSTISSPDFIKAHLTNSLSKLPSILMITSKIDDEEYVEDQRRVYYPKQPLYGRRSAIIVYPNLPEQDSLNLPLMSPFDGHVEFVSSCNGIVCVRDQKDKEDIYLFNPLTRKIFKKLPPPICESWEFPLCFDVVFGFDCLSNDFKVLKIGYDNNNINDYKHLDVEAVHLYSSNADSWRVVEVDDIELPSLLSYPICSVLRSGPVVDGVLYLEGMDAIVTFHLHNESFGLIEYPSFMQTRKSGLFDFQGSLAVVFETVRDGSLDEKEVSVWTVEAVSGEVFWNKMFTFDSGSAESIDWVYLYCGAHKFVTKTKLGVALYDYRKKTTKYVRIPSSSFLVRVLKHTERFLSVE